MMLSEPKMPESEPWNKAIRLSKEKEVSGIFISGHPLDEYKMELENYTDCNLEQANDMMGVVLKMGGLVAHAQHGISQKNNMGYARITLQDYSGGFEFGVYREEYEKYKDILQSGYVLYVEGIWKKGYSSSNYFFNIKDIRLMASISQDLTRSLTIRIPINKIDEPFIKRLKQICSEHTGKHSVKMQVMDVETDMNMDFKVGNQNVSVDSEMITKIRDLGLSYKVN